MVWVRDLEGTKRPEDDAIRFYYITPYVQMTQAIMSSAELSCSNTMEPGDEHVQRLRSLTERILGPVDLRSPERPTRNPDGTYQGGTALERTDHANGVKGARCYTTAYSYQN